MEDATDASSMLARTASEGFASIDVNPAAAACAGRGVAPPNPTGVEELAQVLVGMRSAHLSSTTKTTTLVRLTPKTTPSATSATSATWVPRTFFRGAGRRRAQPIQSTQPDVTQEAHKLLVVVQKSCIPLIRAGLRGGGAPPRPGPGLATKKEAVLAIAKPIVAQAYLENMLSIAALGDDGWHVALHALKLWTMDEATIARLTTAYNLARLRPGQTNGAGLRPAQTNGAGLRPAQTKRTLDFETWPTAKSSKTWPTAKSSKTWPTAKSSK